MEEITLAEDPVEKSSNFVQSQSIKENSDIQPTINNKMDLTENNDECESDKNVSCDSDDDIFKSKKLKIKSTFIDSENDSNNIILDELKKPEELENSSDSENISGDKKTKRRIILNNSDDENLTENAIISSNIVNEISKDSDSSSKGKTVSKDSHTENADKSDNIFNDSDIDGPKNGENKGKSRLKIFDSDSSDDENRKSTEKNEEKEEIKSTEQNLLKKSRFLTLCDSESSEDENDTKSTNLNQLNVENEDPNSQKNFKSRFSTLCDSDNSDDDNRKDNKISQGDNSDNEDNTITLKKSRSKKSEKPKKMTGRDAMEQRKEIISESQRMVRETHVSLPYHRAKSHSLKEFMSRRNKMSDLIKSTISVPNHLHIKMNVKQLEIAAKQLEEREKNLEEFYKSESESEEEEKMDCAPPQDEKVDDEPSTDDKIDIESQQSEKIDGGPSNDEKMDCDLLINENMDSETIQNEKMDCDTSPNQDKIDKNTDDENSEVINKNTEVNETKEYLEDIENILGKINEENAETATCSHDLNESKILENNHSENQIELAENSNVKISKENQEQSLESLNQEINNKIENNDTKIDSQNTNEFPKTGKMSILDKLRKLNPLLALKTDFQPKITGNSSEIIILGDDAEKSKAIDDLKKRFITHNQMKSIHTKDEKEIESIDTNILKHESAKVLIDHDNGDRVVEQKPGIKLKKLREELSVQMAKKRLETWEKHQKEIEELNPMEEKEDCGMENDELEEAEMTESSSDSSDDDEDDIGMIREKPRVKSAFADDEAEVSDDDEEDDDDEADDYDENSANKKIKRKTESDNIAEKSDDASDDDENDDADDENSNYADVNTDGNNKKKALKRIISNDSDSENEFQDKELENPELKKSLKEIINAFSDESNDSLKNNENKLDTKDTENDFLHDTVSLPSDEDEIPLYQHENLDKTPRRITQSKTQFHLTPISCLTAWQGKSASKSSISESPIILPLEPSPLRKNPSLKTKLFENNETEGLTQAFEELENLCSGKFTGEKVANSDSQENSQDDELLGIISGKFDIPEIATQNDKDDFVASVNFGENLTRNISDDKKDEENIDFDWENSQDIKLTYEKNILKDDEKLSGENKKGKLAILSSDEEENLPEFSQRKKKKKGQKNRKLGFSDDELSEDSELDDELQDEQREINYDSEENEIEFDGNEDGVAKKVAKTFFEAEAELSESEWGSADEDERDLDTLEMEDGDEEQFNEKKLQNEVGRIHMRQVLDQDNREVRLLQEMLLEDGELHGASRERKFKWKNADSLTWNDDNQQKDPDEDDPDEIESELHWRKMRHEREVFLEEQRKKALQSQDEVDLLASDSQIMQLGKEVLKKSQEKTSLEKTPSQSMNTENITFSLLNQKSFRGSFLARSETSLSRLMELTKTKEVVVGTGPKNSRSFLFTSVSRNDDDDENGGVNEKKRKATEGTPKILKKMRISENSPAGGKAKKAFKKMF